MNEVKIKIKILTLLAEKDRVSVNDIIHNGNEYISFFEVFNVVMKMVEDMQLTLIARNKKLEIEEIDKYNFYISYIKVYDPDE